MGADNSLCGALLFGLVQGIAHLIVYLLVALFEGFAWLFCCGWRRPAVPVALAPGAPVPMVAPPTAVFV